MNRIEADERHYPDLAARELPGVLFQIADGRRSGPYTNVIKETASIHGCQEAARYGSTVVVLWEMPAGGFRGNYVGDLVETGVISDDSRTHGSGTPGTKFFKGALRSAEDIMAELLATHSDGLGV